MKLSSNKSVIFLAAIIALVLIFGFEPIGVKTADAKVITISGKITQVDRGWWRRAILHVKTAKGNLYQIHVGMKTVYVPHQTPVVGNYVACTVEKINEVWVCYRVTYK